MHVHAIFAISQRFKAAMGRNIRKNTFYKIGSMITSNISLNSLKLSRITIQRHDPDVMGMKGSNNILRSSQIGERPNAKKGSI